MNKLNNKELKEILENKNEKNFKIFYEKYFHFIYSISFSILRNKENSEDVTQDICIKIWKMPKEKMPTTHETTWLYSVVKNATIEFLRKEKNTLELKDIYIANKEDEDIKNVIGIDSYNRIISKLDEKEQEIVSLKILSDLSFKEISKLLGIPIGTVQWRYYKALNTLKTLLTNLSMFILTFVVYIVNKRKSIKVKIEDEYKEEIENEQQNKIITEDSSEQNSSKQDSLQCEVKQNLENIQNNIQNENIILKEENNLKNDTYNNIILGFSTIFLTLTIIFTIIFIKHQQNGKKKTSK